MRLTALDIQNHAFPRSFRGYHVDEVEQFRRVVVEDYADLSEEAARLRRRVETLERRVEELGSHERALRDAMLTAQGVSDDLRRTAENEAQMRVGQAELQAEKILAAAHRQASRLAQDVRELRSLRSRMASSVRATIETHLALLEGFSGDSDDEGEHATTPRIEALVRRPDPDPFGPPGPPPAEPTAGADPAEDPRTDPPGAPEDRRTAPPGGPEDRKTTPPRGPARSAGGWAVYVDQG